MEDLKLGSRIKKIRTQAKKNQKIFAEELGVSQSHISNIEKGTDKPSLTLIKFICKLYDVSEEWLINNEGNMYIYDSWGLNDDEIIGKYICFKRILDESYSRLNGKNRIMFVDAFSFFVTIMEGKNLNNDEFDKYIENFYKLMDNIERICFIVSTYENVDLTKHKNYFNLFSLVTSLQEPIENIDTYVSKLINVYVEKYNLPYRFK